MEVIVVSTSEWLYPTEANYATGTHAIELRAARGTYASVQIRLDGVPDDANVKWNVTEPLSALAPEAYELIAVNVEKNVYRMRADGTIDDDPLRGTKLREAPFRVYDCVKPLGDTLSAENGVAALYFCFPVARTLTPDTYSGSLVLEIGSETITVPVEITAYAATVPEQKNLKIYNFYSPVNLASYQHVKAGTDAFDRAEKSCFRAFRRMYQNVIQPGAVKCEKTGENEYAFDFMPFVARVKKLREMGFEYFALSTGGRISWLESTIVVGPFRIPAMSYEGYVYLSQYLPALDAVIRENGWQGHILMSVSDEPNDKNATEYRALAGLIRKLAPSLVLYDALSYTNVHGALDIWVPKNSEYDIHMKEFESFRGKGDEIWHYTCCNPRVGGYVNRFLDYPLLSTRYLFWGNYKYDLAGFLHWGGNLYQPGQDPYTVNCPYHTNANSNNMLPAGDTHIVYPGEGENVYTSMRLEVHRESEDDFELLRIIAARDKEKADAICAECFRAFNDVNYDPVHFENVHKMLLEEASV